MENVNGHDFTEELDSSRTGLTFVSEVAAYNWAKGVANGLKFNIAKATRKKRRRMVGQFHQYFKCVCAKRSEKPETKEKNERKKKKGLIAKGVAKLKKRITSSQRVGCPFRGVIRTGDDGNYHVIVFEGRHSHALTYYVEGNANYTRLNENDKLKVKEMHRSHCKPKVIVDALQHSEASKPYLLRPVYNEIAKINREEAQGRNPAREFFQLARNRDYFTRFTVEPGTDQLRDIFWSHPSGRKLLRCYPNVFCIDATYSTNKYNYALIEIIGVAPTNQNFTAAQVLLQHEDKASYKWVMGCLEELLGKGIYPEAIVTDRELGLFEAIATCFPKSNHVLCMHHVKKMIRAKAITLMKTEKEADSLCRGAVRRMLEAPTVEEFIENERLLRLKYEWVPGFMKYMDEIWLPHKEKICLAWTNKIRHYGNNTTNRVESAHSSLKDWMTSCRGGVDTLFDQTYAESEGQTKSIRCKLEQSRSRNLEGFDVSPFMLLLRVASHHCLTLLKSEYTKLGRCTHAMPETHGLPCRCQMEILYQNRDFILPRHIDCFWTTLVYDGDAVEVYKCPYDISAMVEDFGQRDPADQLRLSQVFHAEMYPEKSSFEEPEVNLTKKGRPSKKKTKGTRELSGWEHVDKKFGTGPSSQASNNSSINDDMDLKLRKLGSWDVPEFVREHLVDIDDVEGDGNCGFRCAALRFMKDQDEYVTVRMFMIAEMNAHKEVYKAIYEQKKGDGEFEKAIKRINWTQKRCTSSHWMQTPCDLIAMAQVFRAVVSLYTVDKTERYGCSTVFPWRGHITSFDSKLREISIIHRLGRMHYVLGHFSREGTDPDQPLPTVHPIWKGIRDRSLRVWADVVYAERLGRFTGLQELYMGYIQSQVPEHEKKPDFYDLDPL